MEKVYSLLQGLTGFKKTGKNLILFGIGVGLLAFISTWFFVNNQLAGKNLVALASQDSVQTFFYNPKAVEFLVKQKMIVRTLKRNGKITSSEIKNILAQNVLNAQALKNSEGFTFITGSDGIAEGKIPKGKYILDAPVLANVAFRIPTYLDLSRADNSHIIGISISEGETQVIKMDPIIAQGNGKGSKNTDIEFKVVVFRDDNKNGVWDKNEKILPWAGVQLSLKKQLQQEVITLIPGWNLVTLTTIPVKKVTASELLNTIISQGGKADIVSTLIGDEWKSYVVRENNTYSNDNFLIEPSKAYFVRALLSSAFVVTGQDLVAPIPLDLQAGWNAVGLPFLPSVYHADTLLKSLNSSSNESELIARFEFGLWDSFVEKQQDTYGNNFLIENNRGYLIRLEKGVQFIP